MTNFFQNNDTYIYETQQENCYPRMGRTTDKRVSDQSKSWHDPAIEKKVVSGETTISDLPCYYRHQRITGARVFLPSFPW